MNTTVPHVLLIDDDRAVLEMVSDALIHYGMLVHPFSDGNKALGLLQEPSGPPFDLVISDINMDGLDGFDVIHRVKSQRPHLPVVLMTGQASVEYAIRAMRLGAANLFVKPLSLRDLVKSVFHLVELHRDFRLAQDGLRGLVTEQRHFIFRSDELDIPSLIRHLTDRLIPLGFATENNIDVIAMAFHEALVNALDHGNLELDSSLKGDLLEQEDPYTELRRVRLGDPTYAGRELRVDVELNTDRFAVSIVDSGPGFDVRKMAPANDHETMARLCGRGLPLIHMVMHEVHFSDRGNQIQMVLKKRT
jgi:DNA-binding response OmpR family regulator/anti-sigma regulatory factor (Ser/Thr protein kinase)